MLSTLSNPVSSVITSELTFVYLFDRTSRRNTYNVYRFRERAYVKGRIEVVTTYIKGDFVLWTHTSSDIGDCSTKKLSGL